ncbi:MAG: DUF6364 family protein [Bacillota bacterium]
MHRKLTLRLDEALIHKMKRISKKSGKSVSRMVADYFSLIGHELDPDRKEITPRIRSLYGALADAKVSEDDHAASPRSGLERPTWALPDRLLGVSTVNSCPTSVALVEIVTSTKPRPRRANVRRPKAIVPSTADRRSREVTRRDTARPHSSHITVSQTA